MIIVISGASGFIGSVLVRAFEAQGHEVRTLVRRPAKSGREISWDIDRGTIDAARLEAVDAVIHLAGESLVQRWSAGARRRIRESRVRGTMLIAQTCASLAKPPRALLSGSAIGIYGSHRDEPVDESSPLGRDDDFLASVCKDWEEAAEPAADAGIRVVSLRTGLVMSKAGGVLGKMLLPFRLGVGGRLGNGHQWMSCIALDDYIDLVGFCVRTESMRGPVNLVCPEPVTNTDFTKALGRVLGRPTPFPVPRIGLTLAFGAMADDTLFASQRVRPARALGAGFSFSFPTLEAALRSALRD